MKILYLGTNESGSTSRHRIEALKRIGHKVDVIETKKAYQSYGLVGIFHYRTGYKYILKAVEEYVLNKIKNSSYDLIFVNHGHDNWNKLIKKNKTKVLFNYQL